MTVARKYDNYLSARNAAGIINQLYLCDFRRSWYDLDNRTPGKCNQKPGFSLLSKYYPVQN